MWATCVPWWKCCGSFAPGAMVTRWRYSSCPGPFAGAADPHSSRVIPLFDDPTVVELAGAVVVCAAADEPVTTTARNTSATKARVIDRELCIRSSSTSRHASVGHVGRAAAPRPVAATAAVDHGQWFGPPTLVKPVPRAHTRAMATTILVVFNTSEGQTAKIADHIAAVLRELGDEVEVHDVAGAPAPEHYDGLVVGDSIHAVHHSRALTRYLRD